MTKDELNNLTAKLQNLFNKADWNDDLLQLWTNKLCGFSFKDSIAAIEEHRQESKVNTPHLEAVIAKLMNLRRKQNVGSREHERVIDWLRRNKGKYAGWKNEDILMDHYAGAWQTLEPLDLNEGAKQRVRATILSHCRQAFIEIQTTPEVAMQNARFCVGLDEGETITAPRMFKVVA